MEGELCCEWNGIRANDIRVNGRNGVPLTLSGDDLFSALKTSQSPSNSDHKSSSLKLGTQMFGKGTTHKLKPKSL